MTKNTQPHIIDSLPLVLAGPALRHCDAQHFTLWFVSSMPLKQLSLTLGGGYFSRVLTPEESYCIKLGEKAFQYLINVTAENLLPIESAVHYQVVDSEFGDVFAPIDGLTYADDVLPSVRVSPNISNLLHGSCRQAHHESPDALVAADSHIAELASLDERPALLMLSGDQVYVDDIAGPMLYAIGQVITLLGLPCWWMLKTGWRIRARRVAC